jgi:hypothetical protein
MDAVTNSKEGVVCRKRTKRESNDIARVNGAVMCRPSTQYWKARGPLLAIVLSGIASCTFGGG